MGKEKKNEANHNSSNEIPEDSVKLLIREEVERRLNSPTVSLVKFIEDEVRARIRRQEWYYWGILVVVATSAFVYGHLFWNAEISQIPSEIKKQISSAGLDESQKELTNYVANARTSDATLNRLMIAVKVHADDVTTNLENLLSTTKSTAENVNSNLTQIPSSIDTNIVTPFSARLEQLKNQDNVLLVDDFSKMFIKEIVTNLVDESSMVLSYEPIPSTIRIYSYIQPGNNTWSRYFLLDNFGYCEGRSIYFTNKPPALVSQVLSHVQTGGVLVEYVRKNSR